MRIVSGQMRLAVTDVSNHLACHHLTHLELGAARGNWQAPEWQAPDLAVIRERGLRHEAGYLAFLEKSGLEVVNLAGAGDEVKVLEETQRLMERGVEVIAQGALSGGRWFGKPDVLRRVKKPSALWDWSYEAYDCKLARGTKATTILQLSFYSELLGEIQGGTPESMPERMWVVAPGTGFAGQLYRVDEYSAYYRYVKRELEKAYENRNAAGTYPEPCPRGAGWANLCTTC